MDDKLKRLQELKAQKAKLSEEIATLGEEIAAELKAALSSGKPRKRKGAAQ